MTYEAVLFDVDDTLCRYRRTGDELLAAAFERTGHDRFIALEEYHDRYPEFVNDSDSVIDLRAQCFAAIAEKKGHDPSVGRRIAEVYADERDHGNVEPLAGVETALSALDDLPLGVVTNGAPAMQSAKLEALGLSEAFDVVVHAGYDAPAKPSPAPFEAALSKLSVRPERAVHVGNSLRSDVAGAQAAGVRTVWLAEDADPSTARDPEPDHVISTLAELPSVIRQ
ncbi:haloacid dehalogenase [Halobacteriales archaeon QS_9_68_42]|nr:MAG: haloacid dehalogenase [Halobacteriales archaeon QS_9_68_42]